MGWYLKISEVAARLNEKPQHISGVCGVKGWMGRLRSSKQANRPQQAIWGHTGEFDCKPTNNTAQLIGKLGEV